MEWWFLVLMLSPVFTLRLSAGQPGQLPSGAPHFTEQPSNTTAYISATLNCSASGATISWFKDGALLDVSRDTRLSQSSSGNLVVSELQETRGEELEGKYYCTATNSLGTVRSRTAYLTRTVWLPGFTGPLPTETRTILRNSFLNLTCRHPFLSVPPASITWNVDSSNIVGVARDGRLVFSYVNERDVPTPGTLTCTVTNPVSRQSLLSSQYFLDERVSINGVTAGELHPVQIEIGPMADQTVVAGDTITLECFSSGRLEATVTWEKDGVLVQLGGRLSTAQGDRQLVITLSEPNDAGTYTCTAVSRSNTGPSANASGRVQIIVPPVITTSFPAVVANASQSFTVTCASSGTLPLEWVWLHNNQVVVLSEREEFGVSGSSTSLTVRSPVEGDEGMYQCIVNQPATGRHASHYQFIEVRVVPPTFLPNPTPYPDVLAEQFTNITIPCMAVGFPTPSFTWSKVQGNDRVLIPLEGDKYSIPEPGTGDGSLTITSVLIDDSSNLQCTAQNSGTPVNNGLVILRVIAPPNLVKSINPHRMLTPKPNSSETLACAAEEDVTMTTLVRYQWTRDGNILEPREREDGRLVISPVMGDGSTNGLYECSFVVEARQMSAAPLIIPAVTVLLTVGEAPRAPAPPELLLPEGVASDRLTLRWNAPRDNGGLAILNYTVVLDNRGSPFCPGSSQMTYPGIAADDVSLVVTDLPAGFEFQFYVIVFTFVFSTSSRTSSTFSTLPAVPRDPPTQLQILTVETRAIRISWVPPTSCSGYGGSILHYVIQYRAENTGRFINEETMSSSVLEHTLTDLTPNTNYIITVAASNSQGHGAFSPAVMETTRPVSVTLEVPVLNATPLNATSISLSWQAPPISPDHTLSHYFITYERAGSMSVSQVRVGAGQLSLLLSDLAPHSTYIVNITAHYQDGIEGPTRSQTVTLPPEGNTVGGVISQPWFYAVVGVAGVVLLVIVLILACCICYQLCCKKGLYNVGDKHGSDGDGVANASRHFSEYRRKQRTANAMPHVTVHSSPTPSRRSSDYARPELTVHHPVPPSTGPPSTVPPSSGPPSTINLTSSALSSPQFGARNALYSPHSKGHTQQNGNLRNGGQHLQNGHVNVERLQFHPYRDMTPSLNELSFDEETNLDTHMSTAEHLRRTSATQSQKFVDTLSRVHTPPLAKAPPNSHAQQPHPPREFGSSYLAKAISQDIEEPWNPGEFLNARGHMTNNPSQVTRDQVGRSESFMSTESSNSMEFRGPSQLADRKQGAGPLSPLTESHQYLGEDMVDGREDYLTRVDEITMGMRGQGAHNNSRRSGGPLSQGRQEWGEQGYSTDEGGMPVLASYEPEVHMSHSRSVHRIPSPTLSDAGYAVPPSRGNRTLPRPQEEEGVYLHPPPAYAAPPPPDSEEDSLLSSRSSPQGQTHHLNTTSYPHQRAASPADPYPPPAVSPPPMSSYPPPRINSPPPLTNPYPLHRANSPPHRANPHLQQRVSSPPPPINPHPPARVGSPIHAYPSDMHPRSKTTSHPIQSSQGRQRTTSHDPSRQHQGHNRTTSHDPSRPHQDPSLQHQGHSHPLQQQGHNRTTSRPHQDPSLQHQGHSHPSLQQQGQHRSTSHDPSHSHSSLQHQSHSHPSLQQQGHHRSTSHDPSHQDHSLQQQGYSHPSLQHQGHHRSTSHDPSHQDHSLQQQGYSHPSLQQQGHRSTSHDPSHQDHSHSSLEQQGYSHPQQSHPAHQRSTSLGQQSHAASTSGIIHAPFGNPHTVVPSHAISSSTIGHTPSAVAHAPSTSHAHAKAPPGIGRASSASEVRRLKVIPMDGGVKPPLVTPDPPQPDHSHQSSLDGSISSGWSLDKIMRSMEQKASSFENMLAPLDEATAHQDHMQDHMTNGASTTGHMTNRAPETDHMTHGAPTTDHRATTRDDISSEQRPRLKSIPVIPPKPPVALKPKTAPKPKATTQGPAKQVSKPSTARGTNSKNPWVTQKLLHQQIPPAVSPPPDLVQSSSNAKYNYTSSSSGNNGDSSGEDHASIAINKKRPEVPDLTTLDPRKPKLIGKKVPRSVWKPRPMARTIQSSSSESDSEGSEYSVDTVVAPGDTSTLRSAHV